LKLGCLSKDKLRGKYFNVTCEQRNNLIKVILQTKQLSPGSWKYSKVLDWRKTLGRFTLPKAEKVTISDEIFKKEKKCRSPGPHSYKPNH
jgi:hypothetical protein